MKKLTMELLPNRLTKHNFGGKYDQISLHMRHKADVMQARRWRRLSKQMQRSPFIDSRVKHGGGIL